MRNKKLFYGVIITLIVIIGGIFIWIQFSKTPEELFGEFCGSSTHGSCNSGADCETGGCSGQICKSKSEEDRMTTCEWRDCYDDEKYNLGCKCVNNECKWSK